MRKHFDTLLPDIVKEATDWTAIVRLKAFASLAALLAFVEADAATSIDPILTSLAKGLRDDDASVLAGVHPPLKTFI